jgi:hypothetical protein
VPGNIHRTGLFIAFFVVLAAAMPVVAVPVIAPAFQSHYAITADLGQYPLYPFGGNYSALCFSPTDPNELLVAAQVTTLARGIVRTTVARDGNGHITGFSGVTGNFAYAAPNIDSGLAYGPNGVLFATTYPDNLLYQYKPGSFERDKINDLGALGVYPSTGSVTFVPAGNAGAGGIRFIQNWPYGRMYTADLAADGGGTYNVTNVTGVMEFGGGNSPGQMLWVPPNSPGFDNANKHVLLANYGSQRIAAYQLDANGHPNFGTQSAFMTGLVGSLGAVVDPLTGDFLFSTYGASGAGDHIYVVSRVTGGASNGDYNGDGFVNAADYPIWRKTNDSLPGYNAWRSNFGQPVGDGSVAGSAVPETATLVTLLCGICAHFTSRRRRPHFIRA